MAFQANLPKFEAANCAVVGCSNDPVEKNTEFATKEGFAYPLLCDTDLAVAKAYDSAKPEGDAQTIMQSAVLPIHAVTANSLESMYDFLTQVG